MLNRSLVAARRTTLQKTNAKFLSTSRSVRSTGSQQPVHSQSNKEPSRHALFYRNFAGPMVKIAIIGLATLETLKFVKSQVEDPTAQKDESID